MSNEADLERFIDDQLETLYIDWIDDDKNIAGGAEVLWQITEYVKENYRRIDE
jgi:hypothetical protein